MFTRENKPLFWQKWTTDVFSYFRPPCWCPCTWAPTWRPILISINLCETLCQMTRVWNTAQTWGLDRVLIYISSIACKFLDFIHWMVFDFYFDGVTVKTGNSTRMQPYAPINSDFTIPPPRANPRGFVGFFSWNYKFPAPELSETSNSPPLGNRKATKITKVKETYIKSTFNNVTSDHRKESCWLCESSNKTSMNQNV